MTVENIFVIVICLFGSVFVLGFLGGVAVAAFVMFGSKQTREARKERAIPFAKICFKVCNISWTIAAAVAAVLILFAFIRALVL
jgi:hypothetical protein